MEASNIIDVITAAFQGVGRGVGISLHESRVIDDYGTPTERVNARELDSDTEWQHLRDDDLANYPEILTYADPISWRYHLPAFLVFTLKFGINNRFRKGRFSGSTSYWTTVLSLVLFDDDRPGACEMKMTKFKILNEEQSKAVYLFLEFISQHGVDSEYANEAIQKYWGKFSSKK